MCMIVECKGQDCYKHIYKSADLCVLLLFESRKKFNVPESYFRIILISLNMWREKKNKTREANRF